MSSSLQALIDKAKGIQMTDAQREAQRRSFAYGNSKIENKMISRDSINQAAEKMAAAHDQKH